MTINTSLNILKCHAEHVSKIYKQSFNNIVEANKHKHLFILKALILCARKNIPIIVLIKLLQSGRVLQNDLGLH